MKLGENELEVINQSYCDAIYFVSGATGVCLPEAKVLVSQALFELIKEKALNNMKYEYKIINGWLIDYELNALGADRWELCAVYNGNENGLLFYFKRAIIP